MEDGEEFYDEPEPLDEDEREALKQDLLDVQVLKELLAPRGIRGAVFFCPDCNEDHFLGWDLLKGNLQELLDEGESPVHEPAFSPNPEEYVSWDYARGFLDGYESFEEEELAHVAARLSVKLRQRGLSPSEIKSLLSSAGLHLASDDAGEGS